MKRALRLLGAIAASLLLASCASSRATTAPATIAPSAADTMVGPATGLTGKPTPAALMICGDDLRGKIRQALALTAPPATMDSFRNDRYTCTYRLPVGPLVLMVQQSPARSAASHYYAAQQAALHGDNLPGLGAAAFGTGTGKVVVLKDDATLTVDASGLPAVFGSQRQRRTDLAYEIASDVLGCWTGD